MGGSLIDDLNKIGEAAGLASPLGTRLATELNRRMTKINTRADAQAGLKGSVVVAPQKRIQGQGAPAPGLMLSQNRIGDVGQAINDDETPTWGQVRSLFTCERFGGHVSGFPGWFEDCVEQEKEAAAVATTGIVHAMWGYTYEIPSGSDTNANDDPGVLELFGGIGAYWQYIVPVTTEVDRLTWWNNELINYGPPDAINWALYEMNTSDTAFSRVAETGIHTLSSYPLGTNSDMLDSRITIDPGLYAIALAMPCHKIGGIFPNMLAYRIVNELKPLPRFGTFVTTDGSMPEELNSDNVIPYTNGDSTNDITVVGTVPLAYFDDSLEFSA